MEESLDFVHRLDAFIGRESSIVLSQRDVPMMTRSSTTFYSSFLNRN